jgi:hypothetical protein
VGARAPALDIAAVAAADAAAGGGEGGGAGRTLVVIDGTWTQASRVGERAPRPSPG